MASNFNRIRSSKHLDLGPYHAEDRLRLLLGDRRIVDSDHAALRSRRRQAQASSVRMRNRLKYAQVTLPKVSILSKPD